VIRVTNAETSWNKNLAPAKVINPPTKIKITPVNGLIASQTAFPLSATQPAFPV